MFVNLDHFPKDRVNIKYIWNHLVIILAIREFHDIFHQLDFFGGGEFGGWIPVLILLIVKKMKCHTLPET